MNANPAIVKALEPLGIPVRWLEYKGDAAEYIVFQDALNAPSLYGDDGDVFDTVILQIHYYTKNDPIKRLSEIRKALRRAGFLILGTNTQRDTVSGAQTGLLHSVIKVQLDGISEDFEEEDIWQTSK